MNQIKGEKFIWAIISEDLSESRYGKHGSVLHGGGSREQGLTHEAVEQEAESPDPKFMLIT